MNAMLTTTLPLPAILNQPAIAGPGRRRLINSYRLSELALERFNNLLLRLGRRQPIDCDQLATAAREMCDRTIAGGADTSIHQRMQRMETASAMLDDRHWDADDDAQDAALAVVSYARGSDDLIPDWLPRIGRLDDAIVVDAGWPRLAAEVSAYLDFCRLRSHAAEQRGKHPDFRFDRRDWEQARQEEAALLIHQRDVREHSYLPALPSLFMVH